MYQPTLQHSPLQSSVGTPVWFPIGERRQVVYRHHPAYNDAAHLVVLDISNPEKFVELANLDGARYASPAFRRTRAAMADCFAQQCSSVVAIVEGSSKCRPCYTQLAKCDTVHPKFGGATEQLQD